MVDDGETDVVPAARAEVNAPGAMEMEVAPVVDQLSVLDAPETMPVGLAVNELMTGRLGRDTDTTMEAVALPALLDAVRV